MSTIQEQVAKMYAENPGLPVMSMAEELGASEAAITHALPSDVAAHTSGEHAEQILGLLPTWGRLTTIIIGAGSVFEVKADFPKGKIAHGFYNLMGKEGQLHGHLRIDLITDISFVSKSFRGMESYYMAFFTASGECMFKVYLGRDKRRQLFPEQIELFKTLQQQVC